jgi:hypothetical protein
MNGGLNTLSILPLYRLLAITLLVTALCVCPALSAQQIPINDQIWSAEVIRPQGQPVIPLFDGWFPNEDGTRTLCYGYFNLNTQQSFDIPVGALNSINDDRFEVMLPTHFDPVPPRYRRKFCVFTINVPADFSEQETIVWSLSSSGAALSVPGHILPAFILDEPNSDGRGDIAPLIKLSPDSEGVRGRVGITTEDLMPAVVGMPLNLRAWIEHPAGVVWVGWAKHSGPGNVDFNFAESEVNIAQSPAGVSAIFSEPGDYIVRMQTIDDVAAFEFYCCHSNAFFKVTVRANN